MINESNYPHSQYNSESVEPTEEQKDRWNKINELRDSVDREFLFNYVSQHSPSGFEHQGQSVWNEHMQDYSHKLESNCHGNSVATIRGAKITAGSDSLPKIMIEAHCDEISYIVTKISKDGLIYVTRNGGSDEMIAPSKKVLIHTPTGPVSAVFGWIAIHIRSYETVPDKNSIFLDAGFNSDKEVKESGIKVGQLVTYDEEPMILNDKIIGKSLDNKIGGYVIAKVAERIWEVRDKLNFDLLISNSVQEEVGLHGATMVAHTYKPDVVIVTDVCHDTTTPGIKSNLIGDLSIGKGPVIIHAAAIHGSLNNIANKVSKGHQEAACSGRGTGTDADVFTYANGGTPTMLIKMPLKYMHTTVEMCSISDVNGAIDMMFDTLMELNTMDIVKTFSKTANRL